MRLKSKTTVVAPMLLTGGYKDGSEATVENMEQNLRTTNNISSNCWVVLRGNFKGVIMFSIVRNRNGSIQVLRESMFFEGYSNPYKTNNKQEAIKIMNEIVDAGACKIVETETGDFHDILLKAKL